MINFGSTKKDNSAPNAANCDIIIFGDGKLSAFQEPQNYDKPTELGYTYIITHIKYDNKLFGTKKFIDGSVFEAVLLDPCAYAQAITENGYSGMIVKKYPGAYGKARESYLNEIGAHV